MEFYRQTTEYTCAASSLMMVLNHLNKDFKLSKENEFRIWRHSANLPVRASSIYGLAAFAKDYGAKVSVVLGEKEYDYPDYRFKGYTKKDIDEAKFCSRIHAKNARNANIPIAQSSFSVSDIESYLKDNKILIMRVNAGIFRDSRSTSKYLVIAGLDSKGYFQVFDPAKGELFISKAVMAKAIETLETKKKRDNRVLIFH